MSVKYLTICMNFRDESEYLDEWLSYHLKVGVDHFILYDNNSDDNYLKILDNYIKKNVVTLLKFKGNRVKNYTYPNTIKEFKNFSRWIAFIDCDEFLVPEKKCLKEELSFFEEFAGVRVCTRFFGSNGHISKPKGGVLRNFTKRAEDSFFKKNLVKVIVNPKLTQEKFCNPHHFDFLNGSKSVDTKKRDIVIKDKNSKYYCYDATFEKIYLNHYWCKSYEEYKVKHNKPNDFTGEKMRRGDCKVMFDKYNENTNSVEDFQILRFL